LPEPVNGVFFELAKFHQKREIQNSKKELILKKVFSGQKPEKRKTKNRQICVFGFHSVAKKGKRMI
jgi:hypothetical protein